VLVAADVHHPVAVGGHGDPAGRLAERAAVVVGGDHARLRSAGFVRFVTGYGSGGRFSIPNLRTAMDFFWLEPILRDRMTGIGL